MSELMDIQSEEIDLEEASPLSALRTALFELLVVKEELKLKEAELQGFRRARKRISRVRRSIERQTIGLASELRGEGMGISEISSILRSAEETARGKARLLLETGEPESATGL